MDKQICQDRKAFEEAYQKGFEDGKMEGDGSVAHWKAKHVSQVNSWGSRIFGGVGMGWLFAAGLSGCKSRIIRPASGCAWHQAYLDLHLRYESHLDELRPNPSTAHASLWAGCIPMWGSVCFSYVNLVRLLLLIILFATLQSKYLDQQRVKWKEEKDRLHQEIAEKNNYLKQMQAELDALGDKVSHPLLVNEAQSESLRPCSRTLSHTQLIGSGELFACGTCCCAASNGCTPRSMPPPYRGSDSSQTFDA